MSGWGVSADGARFREPGDENTTLIDHADMRLILALLGSDDSEHAADLARRLGSLSITPYWRHLLDGNENCGKPVAAEVLGAALEQPCDRLPGHGTPCSAMFRFGGKLGAHRLTSDAPAGAAASRTIPFGLGEAPQ